ncbi:hypothetical protein [Parasitella parasitica]|uniref:Amine oxidase n=1 Tax=Parasitella parasitica TaxID=35722 RepID=A0A0B7MS97_9FUNG|nr:hypothetical protein [Parasitella parasitica]
MAVPTPFVPEDWLFLKLSVANYDYGLYYYFYQDGTFEHHKVKVTGELNTHVLAEDEGTNGMGTIVAPQINAQYHQHFFTMRIDPMTDDQQNSVQQINTYSLPYPTGHPENPFDGNSSDYLNPCKKHT